MIYKKVILRKIAENEIDNLKKEMEDKLKCAKMLLKAGAKKGIKNKKRKQAIEYLPENIREKLNFTK